MVTSIKTELKEHSEAVNTLGEVFETIARMVIEGDLDRFAIVSLAMDGWRRAQEVANEIDLIQEGMGANSAEVLPKYRRLGHGVAVNRKYTH